MKVAVEVQFAQKLAANEKSDRDKAIKKLNKWLKTRSTSSNPFQEEELLRIWKGLFYCYWMSDKPLIQEELAVNIASMIDAFCHTETSLLFIQTFLKTMGREWFGIDKWRMDKFMMMARRFLRQVFKFNKKHDWNEHTTVRIRDIFAENLFLANMSDTSLGFQMHMIDVFLEELAKVGGENLDETVLLCYLQTFLKILTHGRETRLRSHVVERIFHYIIRQSDPGIEWEMEKDVEALGNVVIQDENGDLVDEDEEGEEDVDMDEEDPDLDGEVEENGKAEDPRAGRVDVELPQLTVNYLSLSDQLAELGAASDTPVSNRNVLYRLSKHFKDTANNTFPLGDQISDEEIDEKINVKAAVKKLVQSDEKTRKKSAKSKAEYRELVKERKKQLAESAKANGVDDSEDEGQPDNELKRKLEEEEEFRQEGEEIEEEEEESPQTKKARIEQNKQNKKEREKKRKQKLKRKKRERLLAEAIKVGEEKRKADQQVQRDLELMSNMESADPTKSKAEPAQVKHKKTNKEVNSEPSSGDKCTGASLNHVGQKIKNKVKAAPEGITESSEPSANKENKKKKKKKSKDLTIKDTTEVAPVNGASLPPTDDDFTRGDETMQVNGNVETQNKSEKKKKKKKDGKKTSIPPADNNLTKSDERVRGNGNVENSPHDQVKSEKKKKMKEGKRLSVNGNAQTTGKLFEEPSDWDTPMQPGEQEIVLPNKKYKGSVKLTAPEEPLTTPTQQGLPGFDSPKISQQSPGKASHTAVFFAKALSKSVTPKKKKGRLAELTNLKCASEPRKTKRVNFALTKNASQDISDLLSSIASSPGTPHDPAKNPEKSLLKRRKSLLDDRSPELQPVQLNTQLNSISKRGQKLIGKKRMRAKAFF